MITLPLRCVIDASVGIKLVSAEANSPEAHQLLAHGSASAAALWVPDFFFLEIGNVLWKMVQRANLAVSEAKTKLVQLKAMRLTRTQWLDLEDDALAIALDHGTTTYDAAYVATAARFGVPLITADVKLVRKLAGSPHKVWSLGSLTIPALPAPPTP